MQCPPLEQFEIYGQLRNKINIPPFGRRHLTNFLEYVEHVINKDDLGKTVDCVYLEFSLALESTTQKISFKLERFGVKALCVIDNCSPRIRSVFSVAYRRDLDQVHPPS